MIVEVLLGVAVGAAIGRYAWPAMRRRGMERMLLDNFSKPRALMAYHLMSGAQFRMLLGEIAPKLLADLTPAQLDTLAGRLRAGSDFQVKGINAAWNLASVADYVEARGLFPALAVTTRTGLIQAIGEIDVSALVHAPRSNAATYHVRRPPRGPVRLPARYDPVDAVLIHWPLYYPERWPQHARLGALISRSADLHIVIPHACWAPIVALALKGAGADLARCRMIGAEYDDIWVRDCGPTFVFGADGPAAIVTPQVPNGLGYHPRDSEIAVDVARHYGVPVHRLPIILDGGNLLSDGRGLLVVSRGVFHHNADIDELDLRRVLTDYFGMRTLVLVPAMPGELTGHVDGVVSLCGDARVLIAAAPPGHPWYDALEETATLFRAARTADGAALTIFRTPMPQRQSARALGPSNWSYANCICVNDCVLAPEYEASNVEAARTLSEAFDGRRVEFVDYRAFPVGALACQTKEVPRGVLTL